MRKIIVAGFVSLFALSAAQAGEAWMFDSKTNACKLVKHNAQAYHKFDGGPLATTKKDCQLDVDDATRAAHNGLDATDY
jgi:hypothetical protein